jgi:hypothetical protein
MASPSSAVTANFPFPELTKFATTLAPPTYATLQVLQRELNANAMSVYSTDGGGLHGHLTLTVTPARYLQITQVAFPVPVAPPVVPVLPQAPTAAITEAVRLHTEAQRTFKLYHDTDKALLRTIIEATPVTYIEALSDTEFGFANVTTLQMLTHLRDTYGALTPVDRENNHVRMTKPWMPPVPIEVLFKQLEEGQRFAAAAAKPIVDTALARMGYQLILKTGLFPDGCREWRLFPDADQTFAQLKRHFARQDRDRVELATTATAGYNGTAFHVQPAPTAPPSQFLTPDPAHTATPGTTLAATDATALAATVLPSGPALIALLMELQSLRAAAKGPTPAPRPSGTNPVVKRGYCWTHGSTTNADHSSATCKNKAPGHQDTATWRNQLGGNPNQYVPKSRRAQGTNPAPL